MEQNKSKDFSTNLDVIKGEVEITFYKSSGPGGQRKNKKETAVRIHHIPSGVTVVATEYRSQAQNKELAFLRLQKKLKILNKKKKKRIITGTPRYVKKQRLEEKKKHGTQKRLRAKMDYEE